MKDMPLDPAERALLAVIREMDADGGGVDRDRLAVRARGRGLEVGRPLATLVERGLIEQVHRRPFLLARVFGARPVQLLKLTRSGLDIDGATDPSEKPEETASVSADPEPATVAAPDASRADMPVEETGDPASGPSGADPAADPPSAPAVPQEVPTEETAEAATAPAAEGPGRQAASATPAAPARRPVRPDRRMVTAFTEDLGGAPVSGGGLSLSHGVEPEVMEGIRDVLAGFGMELTFAGEALVGERFSRGETAGDALSQVVLFAFAHAVREDVATGGSLGALGLRDYAAEVTEELRKLHAAGLIGEDRLEADLAQILALTEDGAARDDVVDTVLADPVGGLLPPALLPEELRPAGDA